MKNLFLLLCLILSTTSFAQERITNFDVEVIINKDRSINVIELITIQAMGRRVKRGITRNFPSSRSLNGRSVGMNYDILKIEKNGVREPYFDKNTERGYMLYIGSENVYLKPGEYRYRIEYKVPNQIGFFSDFDEIYWNAIGTDVVFPVEKATCRVRVPEGASISQETAYVGRRGSREKGYTLTSEGDDLIYQTTRSLNPNEAFTVAVGLEKGVIQAPGLMERYGTLMIIILGLLFLLPYYLITWMRYGKDPETPASYPIYDAPDDLSPASVSYLLKEKYQRESFTASIIALAIKGYLKIEEKEQSGIFSSSKTYDLLRLKNAGEDLSREEERLFNTLLPESRPYVSIDGEYHSYVAAAYRVHQANLKLQHDAFVNEGNNRQLLLTPILASIVIGGIAFFLFSSNPYADGINVMAVIGFAVIALIGIGLYTWLIKQPTVEKLDVQSRIRGFQMYLAMTEKDRLDLLNPPEMSVAHFEEVLPHAFALGVEHKWSSYFESMLTAAQYEPDWNNNHNTMGFSSGFGNNFGSRLQGSSTKPQESSGGGGGSGGGGFSGGGGGGGGVGGW